LVALRAWNPRACFAPIWSDVRILRPAGRTNHSRSEAFHGQIFGLVVDIEDALSAAPQAAHQQPAHAVLPHVLKVHRRTCRQSGIIGHLWSLDALIRKLGTGLRIADYSQIVADNSECDVRRWWRIGLTAREIEALQTEARALCEVSGPAARKAVLERAQSLGKRHWRQGMRLSRLAACIADQMKESAHRERHVEPCGE
jgi:hypothetical protein